MWGAKTVTMVEGQKRRCPRELKIVEPPGRSENVSARGPIGEATGERFEVPNDGAMVWQGGELLRRYVERRVEFPSNQLPRSI